MALKTIQELTQIRAMKDELNRKFEENRAEMQIVLESTSPLDASVALRELSKRNREMAEELRMFSRVVGAAGTRHAGMKTAA